LILKKSGITPMTIPPPFKTPSATVPISPTSYRHKQVQFYALPKLSEKGCLDMKVLSIPALEPQNCNPFHFNQWFSIVFRCNLFIRLNLTLKWFILRQRQF
jgi:hypothetical protein